MSLLAPRSHSALLNGRGTPSEQGSPRSPRKRSASSSLLPLALPHGEELLVDTGPPTNPDSFGTSSPTSAREIRARPIDIDKEIPLFFEQDPLLSLSAKITLVTISFPSVLVVSSLCVSSESYLLSQGGKSSLGTRAAMLGVVYCLRSSA